MRARTGDTPGGSRMYRLREGNDALAARLAGELKGAVHLGAPVTRVVQRASGVSITVGGGRRGRRAAVEAAMLAGQPYGRIVEEP